MGTIYENEYFGISDDKSKIRVQFRIFGFRSDNRVT